MKPKRTIRLLIALFCITVVILLIGALYLFRSNHDDSSGWRMLKTQDSYTLDAYKKDYVDQRKTYRLRWMEMRV